MRTHTPYTQLAPGKRQGERERVRDGGRGVREREGGERWRVTE